MDEVERRWQSKILRRELKRQANNIEGLAVNLTQLDDYATRTPPRLCELIKIVCRIVSEALDSTPDTQLQKLSMLLCLIGEHLRYAERSRVAHTPWSMIEAVEAFMQRFIGARSSFVIRPQWNYNYANEGRLVENYIRLLEALTWIPSENISSALQPFRDRSIYWISFPRVERLNALLHAAWAHELGHTIATRWLDGYFAHFWSAVAAEVDASARRRYEIPPEAQQDLFADVEIERKIASDVNIARRVTEHALTELIADAFALHVMGPAWFAAAVEISTRQDMDCGPLGGSLYPPWRYRLRLMGSSLKQEIDAVRDRFQFSHFVQWIDESIAVVNSQSDSVLEQSFLTAIPYRHIANHWTIVVQQSLEGIKRYSLAESANAISMLVRRLENMVPPNEYGSWPETTHAKFEDIVNAGWIRKYSIIASDKNPDDSIRTLSLLLLKGIESAHLQSVYAGVLP